TEYLRPAAMANILGDLWEDGEPDWQAVCSLPEIKLHLYGKSQARPRRKMGHLTALAPTAGEAREAVLAARRALTRARDDRKREDAREAGHEAAPISGTPVSDAREPSIRVVMMPKDTNAHG